MTVLFEYETLHRHRGKYVSKSKESNQGVKTEREVRDLGWCPGPVRPTRLMATMSLPLVIYLCLGPRVSPSAQTATRPTCLSVLKTLFCKGTMLAPQGAGDLETGLLSPYKNLSHSPSSTWPPSFSPATGVLPGPETVEHEREQQNGVTDQLSVSFWKADVVRNIKCHQSPALPQAPSETHTITCAL